MARATATATPMSRPGPAATCRALLATLFLSRGTPMLTAGDEFGRSQRGNNNAYAQDNETTWLDWDDGRSSASSISRRDLVQAAAGAAAARARTGS